MKVSVILGYPKKGSFNHAIAETVVRTLMNNGHHVMYHDLYHEKFDPVLRTKELIRDATLDHVIRRQCSEISRAEGIIIIHPNWWGQPPAVLKGWIDRVLRAGVAYKFAEGDSGEGMPKGLLKAKIALIFNTSDTPKGREMRVFGDPLETLWRNCIFDLCGIRGFYRKMFRVIVTSSFKKRRGWLKEVRDTVARYFPHA